MSIFRPWRKQPKTPAADPEPPLGVILHVRRGDLAIGCEVARAPELDRRGETAWLARPAEPFTLPADAEPGRDYWLTVTIMPDDCVLIGDIPVAGMANADTIAWPPDVW